MRLTRDDILALIPHQGRMCLLDGVQRFDAGQIVCIANSHRDADNPLRRDGRLDPIHLVEYGAQAMAVHGGLLGREDTPGREPLGFLASLRDVRIDCDRLDTMAAPLEVRAIRLAAMDSGSMYAFEIHADGRQLASGRTTVMHLEV